MAQLKYKINDLTPVLDNTDIPSTQFSIVIEDAVGKEYKIPPKAPLMTKIYTTKQGDDDNE